jgi:hypothetical protein
MPRQRVDIDLEEFEKLATLQCTRDEVADWFGVSLGTIESRLRETVYREAWERGRSKGKVALRRAQFHNAVKRNNASLQIWLGKQWLSQRDADFSDDSEARAAIIDLAERLRGGRKTTR